MISVLGSPPVKAVHARTKSRDLAQDIFFVCFLSKHTSYHKMLQRKNSEDDLSSNFGRLSFWNVDLQKVRHKLHSVVLFLCNI